VTKGQVWFSCNAKAVNVTPRAAMAAIFCSRIDSKLEMILAEVPSKLNI